MEATLSASLGWMGDRQPSSSGDSNSSEHPYDAYTSCQLWSSPAYIEFTGAMIAALSTIDQRDRGYKARNRGEVSEITRLEV